MSRKIQAILWDFDGTVADSWSLTQSVISDLAPWFRLRVPKTSIEVEALRSMKSYEALQWLKLSVWKLPLFIRIAQRMARRRSWQLHSFEGLPEAWRALHEQGVKLGVVTSNSAGVVEDFLSRHRMPFDLVRGGVGLFRKDRALTRVCAQNNWPHQDVLYVGDETRDLVSARRAGVRVAGVSWGFQLAEVLLKESPDFFFRNPHEILTLPTQDP